MASGSHAAHDTHGHGSHGHGDGHPLVGHLVPYSTLLGTGFALIVLTAITVAVRYVDLGEANIYIAIGIAVIKATLVSLFFMHLRWDRPFNLMVLVGSMLFVILMMVFCMMDVGQYESSMIKGNAPAVQTYLDANAKYAPVTKK
jgi:cytochrome c oxidase subunit 4